MVESVDTLDLKSSGQQCPCGFKSHLEYKKDISPKSLGLFYFRMGAFVISRKLNGSYKFTFTSRKGKEIFVSDGFELRFECEAAIEALRPKLEEAEYRKFKTSRGKFYFRIMIDGNQVAEGRRYSTELLMQKGVDEIRRTASFAEILDFSANESLFDPFT